MIRLCQLLLTFGCLVTSDADADDNPAMGKFLVATEQVGGPAFTETVILILSYEETGTLGLVINRQTEATPDEVLADQKGIDDYSGSLYFGGPVRMHTMRALLRSSAPIAGAVKVVDGIYIARLDDDLAERYPDSSRLRFYIGYAGWGAGQLEQELAEGSWHVISATADDIFADDVSGLWRKLKPTEMFRVSL